MQKIFLTDFAGIASVNRVFATAAFAVGRCDFSSGQRKSPAPGVVRTVGWQGNGYGASGKR